MTPIEFDVLIEMPRGGRSKYEADHGTGPIPLDGTLFMGRDDKGLAVPASDPCLGHLRDIHHLPEFHRLEIQHLFEVYNAARQRLAASAEQSRR